MRRSVPSRIPKKAQSKDPVEIQVFTAGSFILYVFRRMMYQR